MKIITPRRVKRHSLFYLDWLPLSPECGPWTSDTQYLPAQASFQLLNNTITQSKKLIKMVVNLKQTYLCTCAHTHTWWEVSLLQCVRGKSAGDKVSFHLSGAQILFVLLYLICQASQEGGQAPASVRSPNGSLRAGVPETDMRKTQRNRHTHTHLSHSQSKCNDCVRQRLTVSLFPRMDPSNMLSEISMFTSLCCLD